MWGRVHPQIYVTRMFHGGSSFSIFAPNLSRSILDMFSHLSFDPNVFAAKEFA
jgi:hypothetical protein